MSAIQKLTGALRLGPATRARHDYIRVGNSYLEHVKIPGSLESLLRDGQVCTLWVATLEMPTPLFFKSKTYVVYATEIDGKIYDAIDEVRRGWTSAKWLMVASLGVVGLFTILLYVGFLFWIAAVRMLFAALPIDEMRENPRASSA